LDLHGGSILYDSNVKTQILWLLCIFFWGGVVQVFEIWVFWFGFFGMVLL
jgi:hypothetical protein